MSDVRYLIKEQSFSKSFQLFHGDVYLCTFNRQNIREVLELTASNLGFSSKWIGSILRLFLRRYPAPVGSYHQRTDFDRLVSRLGVEGLAVYLRSKGYRVVQKIKVSDFQIINFLESNGYEIEGLCGDVHYTTREKNEVLGG